MGGEYIRDRITQLRVQKGVSEYKMSLDLGHSKGYMQSISSGRTLPSMTEFLSICEYFEIEPAVFFDTGVQAPMTCAALMEACGGLSEEDQDLLLALATRLGRGRDKR